MLSVYKGDGQEQYVFECEVCRAHVTQETNRVPAGWQVIRKVPAKNTEHYCPAHKK